MLALIDGDVIAHLSCKSRFLAKKMPPGYAEVTQMVEDKDNHQFSKEEDREYLEESWDNFQKKLQEPLDAVYAEDYLMAMKSSFNYRDEMYPEYKMNRHKDPAKSNKFVPVIRRLAIHSDLAIESIGREADDMLRIWAAQASAAGDPYVIVSIDKDLDCIPGLHYHIKNREKFTVSEHHALRFFYQQLLSGDPTDNIPGVPRIGPVNAKKMLLNVTDEEEMQEIVVEAYMSAYEKNWYDMLLSNGKMLYLQTSEDDHFRILHWPVVQAFPEAGVQGLRKEEEKATSPAPETAPTLTPAVKPVQAAPSPRVLMPGATIAPSPILRPSPSPAPRLAPSSPVPGPLPCPASKAAAPSPKPFVGTIPTMKGK